MGRDPLDAELEQVTAGVEALLRENRELRARLAEAQARLDAQADCQVLIVPGPQHVAAAMAAMENDTAVRDGDKMRVAGSGIEYVYRSGTWERDTVLSTLKARKQGIPGRR